MALKWSESVMMKFLELYQRYSCLWNPEDDKYKNKDARESALFAIIDEMGFANLTIFDVKNKIKTIRTMYKKELTLILKSIENGAETDAIYEPKLIWFSRADAFLRDVSTSRANRSNFTLSQVEVEIEDEEIGNATGDEVAASPCETTNSENFHNSQEGPIIITELPHTVEEPNKPATHRSHELQSFYSRKRKLTPNPSISAINAAIDRLYEVAEQNRRDDGDEFDVFGKFIAIQLRQMPIYNAILCQDEIQSTIRKYRLQLLNKNHCKNRKRT